MHMELAYHTRFLPITHTVLWLLSASNLVGSYVLTYLAIKKIQKHCIYMNVGKSDQVMS
jgi:hypothetical protein